MFKESTGDALYTNPAKKTTQNNRDMKKGLVVLFFPDSVHKEESFIYKQAFFSSLEMIWAQEAERHEKRWKGRILSILLYG